MCQHAKLFTPKDSAVIFIDHQPHSEIEWLRTRIPGQLFITDDHMRKLQTIAAVLFVFAIFMSSAPAMAATTPVAVASADKTSGPWPLTVRFTGDQSTGSIVKYWWYFGDGYTSPEANPLHTYNCYGTFPVYLTVTDAQGLTNTATLTINALQVVYSSIVTLVPNVKYQKSTNTPISGTVTGTVVVKDTEGYTIQGATVEATWTTPNGIVTQTVTLGTADTFSVNVPKGGSGTYTLRVTNITKTGTFFDSTVGSLSASIQL